MSRSTMARIAFPQEKLSVIFYPSAHAWVALSLEAERKVMTDQKGLLLVILELSEV